MFEIIIIGGGAAGMMAAITAARTGAKVTILEQNKELGKKIRSTRNGRCNFTNLLQDAHCYHSSQSDFPFPVYQKFDLQATLTFFEGIGIMPKDRDGYVYPYSDQATAVIATLVAEMKRLGVYIKTETTCLSLSSIPISSIPSSKIDSFKVSTLNKTQMLSPSNRSQAFSPSNKTQKTESSDKPWKVETNHGLLFADAIICTTGSKASQVAGADGSGYEMAKALGHHIIPVLPALVPLVAEETFFAGLAGIRFHGLVTLFVENIAVAKDLGEIQFTKYGISGIPVFQISRFATVALAKCKKVKAELDLLPQFSNEELVDLFTKRSLHFSQNLGTDFLIGIFPEKLAVQIIKMSRVPGQTFTINKEMIHRMVAIIKHFAVTIIGNKSFEQAQICVGGIDTSEVCPVTLESLLHPKLYFAGEVLDVDGICGGYNLQWAWSSGYVAGLASSQVSEA